MPDLYWVGSDDDKRMELRCGLLDVDLATLTKAKKWWEATIWLPGITPKQYGPLESQKSEIEKLVERWFGLANTSRPAMDDPSRW